ncbi:hypothetical protein H2200_008876 [Cladophialophora chaetospira]|uniref:Cytochrome P450 n=1 Tax=Cladophialophora chaetospira TaxID=386627 RepID=A0AA39CFY6_9EURO|nr:hypothetical protein H2200_008876 [Cladophialophora chaetospira]
MTSDIPTFPIPRAHPFQPPELNAKLLRENPTTEVRLFDGSKAWLITKHKDICEALDDPALSADRRAPGYPEIHAGGAKAKEAIPTFVNIDEPDHSRQRSMLDDAFDRPAVDKMRPMMQAVVDKVLNQMVRKYNDNGKQPIDLIEEFASPVPTQIIYNLLGIPQKDVERLSKDSDVRTGTSRDAAERANEKLNEYIGGLVEERVKEPKDDLVSKLVKEQYNKGNLSRDEVVTLSFLVLTAGNAALTNSIGMGVMTLLDHPDQLDEFKEDSHTLAPQVVNELLRFNTASALNSRRATKEDVEIGGKRITKGSGVICAVQAGDRDPDKTPHPDKFDIHRKYAKEDLLAFGYGPHRCQAEYLSRVQLEIAFTSLLKKLPNLKMATRVEDLEHTPATQNMGPLNLPVTLD